MAEVVKEYQKSGQTGQEFCKAGSMPLTTFDYWRRELSGKTKTKRKLVRVEVSPHEAAGQFTLSLRNGRKIESLWNFSDRELARLIRVAESA